MNLIGLCASSSFSYIMLKIIVYVSVFVSFKGKEIILLLLAGLWGDNKGGQSHVLQVLRVESGSAVWVFPSTGHCISEK